MMFRRIKNYLRARAMRKLEEEFLRQRAAWRADCASIGIPAHLYTDRELIHVERICRRPIGVNPRALGLVAFTDGLKLRPVAWHVFLSLSGEGR